MGWRGGLVASVLLVVLGSCRAIAGLHDVSFVASDGACASVVLPTAGNGRVRLVNAGTQGGNADFCIRESGSGGWGQPVLSAGSPSCGTGLAYAKATVPFAVPVGSVDVETIAAGSSCDGPATSQSLGVAVGDATAGASVVTLMRYGGGTNPELIAALPEEPPGNSAITGGGSYGLRLVNGVSSGQELNAGFPASPSLPTTVAEPLLPVPLSPGGVEPKSNVVPGFRAFDAEGYSVPPATAVSFGFVIQGHHDALFAFTTPGDPDVQTLFAIGDSSDSNHPIRGLLCEDDPHATGSTALLASCALTALPSLAVDTFNTSLYGADAPFNDARKSYVYNAIAGRSSDLMCLIETSGDYSGIVSAAKGTFPYSYFVKTDLDTTPTDPTDAKGNTPPAPTAPPCAGIDPAIVQSIYQCIAQDCTTTNDEAGQIATAGCLSGACAGPITQLYYQGTAQDACIDCILYYANSELSLATGHQACTSDPRQPFGYEGMNGTLMLSRYPLTNTQAFILPGTGFRRAILYAQVVLEDQTVDFFCGQLISPLVDGELPYVGNYGVDIPNQENGWEDEQDLQAQKAVAWIKSITQQTKHPTIIAGDWHATQGTPDDDGGAFVLAPQSPEVMALFDQSLGGAFVRAEPTPYADACEYCPSPTNVYNSGSNVYPEDFTPMFLARFPASSTTDDTLWGQANVVPLPTIPYEPAPASSGPISPYYGRLVHVLRPPVPQ